MLKNKDAQKLEKWRNFVQAVSLEEDKIEEICKKSNYSDATRDKEGHISKLSKTLLFITGYGYALENKDVNKLDQIIAELAKKYKSANADYKKEMGKQYLKMFNLTNTQGETAVMIAAGQGNVKMLKKWYSIPDRFVRSISPGADELQEYYKQSNYSYTTQDTGGRNALMLACKSKNPDCIEYILSPETREILNQKDTQDLTPIEYAIKYNAHKNNYDTVGEFMRVFNHVISKKSRYFSNECFRLDKRYVDVAYQIEDEDMKEDILKAYKKTNTSNTKKVQQSGDISKTEHDEIFYHNNFDEVSNNEVSKKRSMDLSNELEKSSNKRLKTSGVIITNTSKLLETYDIDVDAANNLQKNAYQPKRSNIMSVL